MLKALAESWSSSSFVSREQEESMERRAMEALVNYCSRNVRSGEDSLIEKPFYVYIPEARVFFKGVWDHVLRANHSIIEYKTNPSGRTLHAAKLKGPMLQVKLYALAYERIFNHPVHAAEIQLIESGECFDVPLDSSSSNASLEVISVTAQRIRNKEFNPMPSIVSCSFCPHARACQHRSPALLACT